MRCGALLRAARRRRWAPSSCAGAGEALQLQGEVGRRELAGNQSTGEHGTALVLLSTILEKESDFLALADAVPVPLDLVGVVQSSSSLSRSPRGTVPAGGHDRI